MRLLRPVLLLVLLAACAPSLLEVADRYPLVPAPRELEPRSGEFLLDAETTIHLSDPSDAELLHLADSWADPVRAATGLPLPVSELVGAEARENVIVFSLDRAARSDGMGAAEEQGDAGTLSGFTPERREAEGYRLRVESERISLSARAPVGLFYGLQTLRQLLPPEVEGGSGDAIRRWAVPNVDIHDEPRFSYRGMQLDVGRHFFPVEYIKRYIDLLALYKMNVFHWHLTEDQGWRIEIEKYPRLTEVGGFREETILEQNFDPYIGDGIPHGGFYTQDEVREVVAYAAERHITVIPEIEMPGHSLAALAAYPRLACTQGPFEVATRWGVKDDIYCPKEETFSFLQDVLIEVMELFPSPYIHIGGDEAPKRAWEESPLAQEVIRREGLADENELQSYFIRRIESFLNDHGRRVIGWDEILEGGLAPQATVMSWRGMEGGIEAARQGHDVIMTPTSHAYFDYYQGDPEQEPLAIGGFLPLERVYHFEPVPEELTRAEARYVLGAQGNVWTEYIGTTDYLEYMVFPRMLAMSEVVWSPAEERDWSFFTLRLGDQLRRLGALGVNFRVPDVTGLEEDRLTLDDYVEIALGSPIGGAQIRYTLDGSDPEVGSAPYPGPFRLPVTEAGKVVSAMAFLPDGTMSGVKRAHFARTTLRGAAQFNDDVEPGLAYDYMEGEFNSVDELEHATVARSGTVRRVEIPDLAREELMGLRLVGLIRVPRDGVYTFHLSSDDGSRLWISGSFVIDHDGRHAASVKTGQIALKRGLHPLVVEYFQAGGGRSLRLSVSSARLEKGEVPEAWFRRRAGT